jgi:hypothetical protein
MKSSTALSQPAFAGSANKVSTAIQKWNSEAKIFYKITRQINSMSSKLSKLTCSRKSYEQQYLIGS